MSRAQDPGPRSLVFLDGIRGLAAFYVMTGHCRWLLWEGYAEGYQRHPEAYGLAGKALMLFFSLFRFGQEAVLLFFVLSGFVIHLRYAKQIRQLGTEAAFDGLAYLRRRARRILPPLLLALAVTWGLDWAGAARHYAIHSGTTLLESVNLNIGRDHSLATLAGNLGFVMGFYVPVFGSNGPLWSLAYEGWFYLLYPACFYLSRRGVGLPALGLAAGAVVAAGGWIPVLLFNKIIGAMLCWWLGGVLADVYTGRWAVPFKRLAPLSLLLVPLVLNLLPARPEISWLLWSLGFSGVFALLFAMQEAGVVLRPLNAFQWLGAMSYSLYVIHMPVVVFYSGWLMARSEGRLPRHFGHVVAGMVLALAGGWIASRVVERPFIRSRDARVSLP